MKVAWKLRIVSMRTDANGVYAAAGKDTVVYLVRPGEEDVNLSDVLDGVMSVKWEVESRQGFAKATLVVRGVELDAEAILANAFTTDKAPR